jgi:LuxR family maltose regulon positive regulatory protein
VVLHPGPGGFGKTSLLAQWRSSTSPRAPWWPGCPRSSATIPQRLVQAWRWRCAIGAGRPSFGHTVIEGADMSELEAVTRWLAELAQLALRVVLCDDEAERLQPPRSPALELLPTRCATCRRTCRPSSPRARMST